jgi:hypothetical protein
VKAVVSVSMAGWGYYLRLQAMLTRQVGWHGVCVIVSPNK